MKFAEFCLDDGNARYDIQTPFVIGEYEYATDGRIGIRRPTQRVAEHPARKLPPIEELFVETQVPWTQVSVPAQLEVDERECPVCDNGIINCPCCGQTSKCNNKVCIDGVERLRAIGTRWFAEFYLRQLPSSFEAQVVENNVRRPLQLRFANGWRGVLMPVPHDPRPQYHGDHQTEAAAGPGQTQSGSPSSD